MPWNDADEIVIANGGAVYFAPVGTRLPQPGDSPTAALDRAFVGAGWISEDGASLNVGSTVVDVRAWQTKQAIRREKTEQEIQMSWTMQQWNENNVVLAFGGGTVTGSGPYAYVFPNSDSPLEERSLVVDAIDGNKHYRIVFPRGNVTESVEARFQRGSPALLPITFRILEPVEGGDCGWILTDHTSFAPGS